MSDEKKEKGFFDRMKKEFEGGVAFGAGMVAGKHGADKIASKVGDRSKNERIKGDNETKNDDDKDLDFPI